MTKFAPLDLCKKLVELGCKSESNFFHYYRELLGVGSDTGRWMYPQYGDPLARDFRFHKNITASFPAFEQNDFTGCHEQARQNANILWKKAALVDDCPLCQSWGTTDTEDDELKVNIFRYKMIDSEDWVKYLQASLGLQDSLGEVENG